MRILGIVCLIGFLNVGVTRSADTPTIISIQEEILALANKRHELVGKNLQIRGEMLKIIAQHQHEQESERNEMKKKLQPLRNELWRNQQEIRSLSKSIQEKRKVLANMMKTERMHRKTKKTEPIEDISNVD
ncbi:MAG: hypothetical protein N2316_12810 [Spirochaetes bacterium]|nr:hypothetical protein [Spirochaetota bacterium]